MSKPRINFGDFTGLRDKGVSLKSLESLRNVIKLGMRVTKRDDLIKIGISAEDADLIATNSSLGTDPPARPVLVNLMVTPKDLVGYTLGLRREVSGVAESDETLIPIIPSGSLRYVYDDAVTGEVFTLFVKSPGGDLVQSKVNDITAKHHEIKKADLGKHPIDFTPFPAVPNAKTLPQAPEPLLAPARLKGRLICGSPTVNTEKRQIVIEVAVKDNPTDADFFAIGFAETETNGYFFTNQLVFHGPVDFKSLTAARARVALGQTVIIPIRLEPVSPTTGKLPSRLILFFDAPIPTSDGEIKDGKCSCDDDCTGLNFHEKKVLDEFSYHTVVRTTEPLIETYEIDDVDEIELDDLLDDVDEDVRGKLMGIKVNRGLLLNFISRNQAITNTNVGQLLRSIQAEAIRRKVVAVPFVRKGRVQLDSRNTIDWDEKPTVYQAISVAHGHLLHFKQEWFHDGYSIGDLLYSLPLAPGQKKQIVVFDWDRKESAANVQQLDYQESLYNSLNRDRDVNEVARATLNENIRGNSEASAWGVGGGLGIGAIIPNPVPIGGLLGVAGGFGTGSSSASQNASRTTTASSQQQISDRTVQAANSVRSQRSTVIQTVSQGERFQVSAESVANYNHCHAMTIQYFEVLRHFEVRTRLADVQECLFVPLKMSPFTPKKALRWRDILFRCLRKRFLGPGFDALYRIEEERESSTENYYDKIGLPRDRFAEEELDYIEGELIMEFQVQRPRNDATDEFVEANWTLWTTLLGNPREFYDRYLRNEQQRDDAFVRHAGPRIAQAIFDELRFYAVKNGTGVVSRLLPVDATLLSDFRNRSRLNVSLRMSGPMIPIKREDIDYVKISLDGATSRSGILRSLTNNESVRIIVHSGSMRYRTKNLHEHLFHSTNIKNDLTLDGDDVRVFCPLSAKALRRPRLEDVDVSNDLLHHLNENLEYYHQCIWSRMDPQRRFMLLDGVVAPGRANGRSVASVVENKLIGIIGNCLVMPVAPGFKLDPVLDETVDLFEHYYEDPRDPIHISLPTKGVFAEAVMGRCNSCEKKDESRFWRWEESPIPDSPTSINAVTVPTPQPVQPNLMAKDFPAPLIALQNAPNLPDPQGFGALAALLSNPNLFRDLTGLTENQRNAIAALRSSLEAAQKFGEGAQSLTGQAAELFKFSKLSEMLGKGQITKEEFKDLVSKGQRSQDVSKLKEIKEAVDKKQITPETGERLNDATLKKIESEAQKPVKPSLTGAAVSAAEKGQAVKASSSDADGNVETLDTGRKEDVISLKIDLSKNDAITRAFGRPSDKTGVITVQALFENLPATSTIEWSAKRPAAIKIKDKNLASTQISCIEPGLTDLVMTVTSDKGVLLKQATVPLCVPQFITIDEDKPLFDQFLADFQLGDVKEELLRRAKSICETLLQTCNLRLVWTLPPFNERLPAQFTGAAANYFSTVVIKNDNPANPGTVGEQFGPNPAASSFNDTAELYPSEYQRIGVDIDPEVADFISTFVALQFNDVELKTLWIEVMSRMIGETLAHEILHSVTATNVPLFIHNQPPIANDILNEGGDRSFVQRTGIEIINAVNFPNDKASYRDGGSPLSMLTKATQDKVDLTFPVPPKFI